jgi:uncharacterized protein
MDRAVSAYVAPMLLGVPVGELALLAAAILAAGALTGFLAGLFGVGGGAIIVPVLYEVFRLLGVSDAVRMKLCVGTSLAIIVPTSIRSFLAHRAARTLPLEVLRTWIIPILVGVACGALIAAVVPAAIFKLAFVVLASAIAANYLFTRPSWRLGAELPGRNPMWACGFGIGLYSSLMGVGGGAVSTLILTLYGRSIHTAIGISAGVGILISVAGTIGYALAGLPDQGEMPPLSVGYVSFLGLALMAPVSTLAAPFGARVAHVLQRRTLEVAFATFLLLVAARFVASLVW